MSSILSDNIPEAIKAIWQRSLQKFNLSFLALLVPKFSRKFITISEAERQTVNQPILAFTSLDEPRT